MFKNLDLELSKIAGTSNSNSLYTLFTESFNKHDKDGDFYRDVLKNQKLNIINYHIEELDRKNFEICYAFNEYFDLDSNNSNNGLPALICGRVAPLKTK